MRIKKWNLPEEQYCRLGKLEWSVAKLFELSRGLPVMIVPLDHISLYYTYDRLTVRELVMHMKAVQDADLSYPIIMDEDGEIMDGRHRLMKAMLDGEETIKVVRFDENPPPCKVID